METISTIQYVILYTLCSLSLSEILIFRASRRPFFRNVRLNILESFCLLKSLVINVCICIYFFFFFFICPRMIGKTIDVSLRLPLSRTVILNYAHILLFPLPLLPKKIPLSNPLVPRIVRISRIRLTKSLAAFRSLSVRGIPGACEFGLNYLSIILFTTIPWTIEKKN